ncbi:FadR/GntR family transcriptional regulator [Leucobacter aridicollis]|uniref:GntR family transcriptional repressor for pyruvate dehydrogenase complex n=1 Tax=Leucobacter aridicollis TaxID=283878 RepID=A0A852R9Z4_9MICO|nr:FadR/GntR family transcriptional regulator [Leucobacter aridicollis]MBL3681743.1 FadR family transcriptional regulator [Leucobacter aridicollis]NYD27219.1 GntR family transcriptional repressor for pyruvate dehydrogenase complex [Leucobacter aridicollis]
MDWTSMKPATTLSLPDRLSVDLERLILDGELAPGDRLPPERALAEHLGVSRVSIREALRELENRGLIDRKPGRGTVVLSPGERSGIADRIGEAVNAASAEIRDIMELRAIVEPPIARITAGRARPRDIAQLRELVEAMESESAKDRYAELDRAFHQSIAQYTHNPLLELINEQIAQQIAPSRGSRYQTRARRQVSSAAHRRIFEAIAAGDGDLAEAEARAHVLDIADQIALADHGDAGADSPHPDTHPHGTHDQEARA